MSENSTRAAAVVGESVWLATDGDRRCFEYRGGKAPVWKENLFRFLPSGGYYVEYCGPISPPPGKCVHCRIVPESEIAELATLREKLAAETKCVEALQAEVSRLEKMPEQVQGLLELLESVEMDGITSIRVADVRKFYAAYEAAQSAESKFGECETCGVGQHLPSGACDHCGTKKQEDDPQLAKLLKACRNAYNAGPGARRVLLGSVLHEWAKIDLPSQSAEPSDQQATIERLTKERDEARAELANERSVSDQVIDERNATIAELRSELDETRTERHAYKSRLREFCQRLVDMVGADGPEDVEGMLDKVNAEIQRLKQSIDSLNASLADKEGFLNSAGDEIQRLMEDRDEAVVELRSLSTYSGQVIAERDAAIAEPQEQIRKLKIESATQTDAVSERDDRIDRLSHDLGLMTKEWNELQAKLDKPEMPECVRSLIGDIIREVPGRFSQAIAAVEAHYDPPFKVDKPGWYLASDGKEWRVAEIDGDTAWGRNGFVWYGFSTKRVASSLLQLTEYLRPLEG